MKNSRSAMIAAVFLFFFPCENRLLQPASDPHWYPKMSPLQPVTPSHSASQQPEAAAVNIDQY
jgi:hypothetical protein